MVLLAVGISATARYPVFVENISSPERAEVIDDIERSQAWHGHLTEGRADYYRFEGEQGDIASFEILVPKRDELRDVRPEVSVSGPGLSDGGARVPASTAPASVYEDLTQSYYWSYTATSEQESSVALPAQGAYQIVVRIDRGREVRTPSPPAPGSAGGLSTWSCFRSSGLAFVCGTSADGRAGHHRRRGL
jgi:hypothetical protein